MMLLAKSTSERRNHVLGTPPTSEAGEYYISPHEADGQHQFEFERSFPDGVWLVEQAELDSPDLLPYAVLTYTTANESACRVHPATAGRCTAEGTKLTFHNG